MDFACTSAMRADLMAQVASNPSVVSELYKEFKRSYKNTDEACEERGFMFTPMILGAHGGRMTARRVLTRVTK